MDTYEPLPEMEYEHMARRNIKCETVVDTLPGTAETQGEPILIRCTKQAVRLVDCFMGEHCMFYPRKHKHALCLEHHDTYADWKKNNA